MEDTTSASNLQVVKMHLEAFRRRELATCPFMVFHGGKKDLVASLDAVA